MGYGAECLDVLVEFLDASFELVKCSTFSKLKCHATSIVALLLKSFAHKSVIQQRREYPANASSFCRSDGRKQMPNKQR